MNNPTGVPISAIVFGGRRAKTAPLVYQSRDWQHGVFVGSIMASEDHRCRNRRRGRGPPGPHGHAALLRLPHGRLLAALAGYGRRSSATSPPKIFNVNWFRTDDEGNFIWPGFGDNLRVLEWILKRCFDEVDARETAIGYLPNVEDINLDGVDVDRETLASLLSVDRDLWREEAKQIRAFYAQFGDKLPQTLEKELEGLEARLQD